MCTVTEIVMACGHIISSRSFCGEWHRCEKHGTVVRKRSPLNSTCANCDRSAHLHQTKMFYEREHAQLMKLYIEAKKVSNTVEMQRLEKSMVSLHREVRLRNAVTSLTPGGDPDVFRPLPSSE